MAEHRLSFDWPRDLFADECQKIVDAEANRQSFVQVFAPPVEKPYSMQETRRPAWHWIFGRRDG